MKMTFSTALHHGRLQAFVWLASASGWLFACEQAPRVGDFEDGGTVEVARNPAVASVEEGSPPSPSAPLSEAPKDGADAQASGAKVGEPNTKQEACSQEGRLRCGLAPRQRYRCQAGFWTPAEPCADGAVCGQAQEGNEGQEVQAGVCQSVAEICQGSAGQPVCDGAGTLYRCSAAGVVESMEACPSARHCQLGLEHAGTCASCIPGSADGFQCQGADLLQCRPDGSGYEPFKSCDTEALCNAVAGDCTSAACSAGQKLCDGDVLMQCADDLSGLEPLEECESGRCDAQAGECNVCVPDSAACDGDTAVTCSTDGRGLTRKPCPPDRPVCVGSGRCVECGRAEDCGAAASCKVASCDLATGMCKPRNADAGTRCPAGLCDGQGACKQCLDAARDCPAAGPCQVPYCNPESGRCEPKPAAPNTRCNGGGSCDGNGRCNQCEPGERMCSGSSLMTCDDDGQGYSTSACPNGTMCTGMGECVECLADRDCDHLDAACKVGMCSQNRCRTGNATRGQQCRDWLGRAGTCASGTCSCTRQCSGAKACGPDGCGGSCGTCNDPEECRDGTCACESQCGSGANQVECGRDACGNWCGSCGSSSQCLEGTCVAPPNYPACSSNANCRGHNETCQMWVLGKVCMPGVDSNGQCFPDSNIRALEGLCVPTCTLSGPNGCPYPVLSFCGPEGLCRRSAP